MFESKVIDDSKKYTHTHTHTNAIDVKSIPSASKERCHIHSLKLQVNDWLYREFNKNETFCGASSVKPAIAEWYTVMLSAARTV